MNVLHLLENKTRYFNYNINPDNEIVAQIEELNEDLIQAEIKFGDCEAILDIGWYPANNPKGKLMLVIVENYDWESPVKEVELSYKEFEKQLEKLIEEWEIVFA